MSCEICGATPAARLTTRWQIGLIIISRTTSREVVLCRTHAVQETSRDLGKTLVLGWWGILAFFINLWVVWKQIGALRTALALPRR